MCHNIVAKHLYEKNGFVMEGIKKNSMFVEGKYVDEFYMAKGVKTVEITIVNWSSYCNWSTFNRFYIK